MTADCVTLWIGESLGPVERACLRSVLRHGHSLALYCYSRPKGVPEGAEVRDAATILPKEKIITHHKGSVALFSDWFRFELQRRALGTWVDTDLYLIAPIDPEPADLFGLQIVDPPRWYRRKQRQSIALGVLRLSPDSPMLGPLLRQFDMKDVPDWLPWHAAIPARIRKLVSGRSDLGKMPWGTAGPFALTAMAERFGLLSCARPCDIFYPVPWYEADWILDSALALEDMVTERSVSVHLWNECIKGYKDAPAPPGSFLARLHDEGSL